MTHPSVQDQLDAFISRVGSRVLEARQRAGMSRRVLSDQSGVSQRTIVLLETGVGNISIALLFRVASALGHSVEWFIAAEQENLKQQRVCLIGLRGAGKSTIGAELSARLSIPFVELNGDIESLSGMSVQELMSLYGQEGYRRLEHQALERTVESCNRVILAAAGGVVSEPETYAYLLKHFHTVWLKASPEEHMERVRRQGDNRPMAGNPQAMKELKSILTSRESLYAAADLVVDTSGKTLASSLENVLCVVKPLI